MTTRRNVLALAASATLAGLLPPALALPAHAQAGDPAAARIQGFYDAVLATMKRGGGPRANYEGLSAAVLRTFDTGTMTRIAVGPRWSSVPAGRQASLQQAFGRFLVATYASRIQGFSGERFEVLGVEPRGGGRLVRTRILEAGGRAQSIDYLVQGGRAVDVYFGAVSELASRRAEFDSILASGGPDALEADLKARTARLLGA